MGTLVIAFVTMVWLIVQPGFEPLVAAIPSVVAITVYLRVRNSEHQRIIDRVAAASLLITTALIVIFLVRADKQGHDDQPEATTTSIVSSTSFPSLVSPSEGKTITSRVVAFAWSHVPGAVSYQIDVRADPNVGEGGGILWADSPDARYDVDMGFVHESFIGLRFYWSVRARFADGGWGVWASPSSFIYSPLRSYLPWTPTPIIIPTPRIAPHLVTITVSLEPPNPIADGKSFAIARAKATTIDDGTPVPYTNVRFFVHGYLSLNGTIFGADEELFTGISYSVVDSGCFIQSDEYCSNLFDAFTDANGEASALFKLPYWGDHMENKPIAIGAWYYVDGGNNPCGWQLIHFRKP